MILQVRRVESLSQLQNNKSARDLLRKKECETTSVENIIIAKKLQLYKHCIIASKGTPWCSSTFPIDRT